MKLLDTGANGFVGNALVVALQQNGHSVRRALRNRREAESDAVAVCDINGLTDWADALRDIDVVIHLAARVHVMHESAADPLAALREVNVQGTQNLARQAAASGAKRLVYVSSVKVNGEGIPHPRPLSRGAQNIFTELDMPAPQDTYGISKWEAEQALHRVESMVR